MRLNIAICDDDKSFMENLEKMLISYSLQFDIDIHVDKYQNGSALLSAYDSSQSSPYQVLMLDIEMPGENGISIAEKIKHTKDFDVLIVFISNYPEYMLDSFSVHPYHFLQKPINYTTLNTLLDDIYNYYKKTHSLVTIISDYDTEHTIYIKNIYYIECSDSSSKALIFHMKDNQIRTTGTLNYWNTTLADNSFILCSRNTLINILHIHFIKDNQIILENDEVVTMSKRNRKKLLDCFLNKIVAIHNH